MGRTNHAARCDDGARPDVPGRSRDEVPHRTLGRRERRRLDAARAKLRQADDVVLDLGVSAKGRKSEAESGDDGFEDSRNVLERLVD